MTEDKLSNYLKRKERIIIYYIFLIKILIELLNTILTTNKEQIMQ